MNIETIIADKHEAIAERSTSMPIELIEHILVEHDYDHRDFLGKLQAQVCAHTRDELPELVIVSSPDSKYTQGLSGCVGVCTDERWLGGSEEVLHAVRSTTALAVLQVDYIVDRYQVFEAKAMGADAILLSAALLSRDALGELIMLAYELALDVVTEIVTVEDLQRIVGLPIRVVAINTTGYAGGHVLDTEPQQLRQCIPDEIIVVTMRYGSNND